MTDRLMDPMIVAVAKRLCYGDNEKAAETWWPHLMYSVQTAYLKKALDIVELVESMQKKPKMKWKNNP